MEADYHSPGPRAALTSRSCHKARYARERKTNKQKTAKTKEMKTADVQNNAKGSQTENVSNHRERHEILNDLLCGVRSAEFGGKNYYKMVEIV